MRVANEDALLDQSARGFWAVADGMGGHAQGVWAAATVCAALEQARLGGDLHGDCEAIADALADANARIRAHAAALGETIGTTIAVLRIHGGRAACLWAGDSRIYRAREGALHALTRDHSQVKQLVASGIISNAEARSHPLANVVTRAIGADPALALDVVEHPVLPGDASLLCSDGLSRCLEDWEIAAILARYAEADTAAEALLQAVLARGAPDNVSLILVRVDAGGG